MKIKLIFSIFILLLPWIVVNGQQVEDSVMYITYISREGRSTRAYESRDKAHNVYDISLDIRYARVEEGERTLMFDGETELLTIPRSSIDTAAIIDWTRSRRWTPEYGRELLDRILKTKRFYFINKSRQRDPDNYIVIRAVYWRPAYY